MSEAARFGAMMRRSAELKQRIALELADAVVGVVDACEASLRRGGKLMFCGNGGSAADSQHLATELLIRLRGSVERPSWPALALTLDPAALTAGGNDYGYERVFERPLRGLGRDGDVLFGITTSGRSPNVVRALRGGARDEHRRRWGCWAAPVSRRSDMRSCPAGARLRKPPGSRNATSLWDTRYWNCSRIAWWPVRCDGAADRSGRLHRLPCRPGAARAGRAVTRHR